MSYDIKTALWPSTNDHYFRERVLTPLKQDGPHCVSTALAIATNTAQSIFQGSINTQDPISWSESLQAHGMKLAYCPADIRKLRFYLPELLAYDDLFALGYYTSIDPGKLLGDPDHNGWLTGSHIVLLHRNWIFDPAKGEKILAIQHKCNDFHTKRIFRFVPSDHKRGL